MSGYHRRESRRSHHGRFSHLGHVGSLILRAGSTDITLGEGPPICGVGIIPDEEDPGDCGEIPFLMVDFHILFVVPTVQCDFPTDGDCRMEI